MDENKKFHELTAYQGNYVVLYFYPMDFTPGCTKEACKFRDLYSDFTAENIKILGVSWDSPQKHKSFIDEYNLQFTLLSDEDGRVSALYKANGWFFTKRFTYIINPQGEIINVYKDFHIDTHAEEILHFISNHKSTSKKQLPFRH